MSHLKYNNLDDAIAGWIANPEPYSVQQIINHLGTGLYSFLTDSKLISTGNEDEALNGRAIIRVRLMGDEDGTLTPQQSMDQDMATLADMQAATGSLLTVHLGRAPGDEGAPGYVYEQSYAYCLVSATQEDLQTVYRTVADIMPLHYDRETRKTSTHLDRLKEQSS